ncbi:metallophosphoesterase [Natronobacterium gregoryi]|uniref:Metallophosphoesterase n=2 Tax=Natronobacterium gregoryi TaxID=44930 RepID=L0AFD9_NATGS|nr:metallophosphoesterase [Natronobacterium gregoryi]AFZ72139.1 putative phosphoesterase, ICC [Natronobacterium gregoryi SP2]ELY62831.1 metallophosphoesterase [Natronobacterium gregoryi SP2]PLK19287.1 metallophosphoesterase [Natronobacterium gregoryi SP2]SFJ54522.1 putative phosphoesterase [Natronobacterium gregoryi]
MTTTAVDVPFSVLERAGYFPSANALVVADIHLGRAVASSVDAPIDDGKDVRDRLAGLLECTDAATVVVAGDLLHSFDRVPRGVERDLEALASTVDERGADLVVTPGNHDTMLEDVFDGSTADEYRLDDETVVCHGHEPPETDADRYVVGHDHPALSVDGRKLPCVLYGPDVYNGADVLVLPAFTRLAGGATVNGMTARNFQSPFVTDADAFYPAVQDGEVGETLWFPPLGECRELL